MKSKFLTASVLATALFAGLGMAPAMAQGINTPGIDNARQSITARIQQGMASGHITPSEAQALYRRDREIAMRENQYKSDGRATEQERQQLRADLGGLAAEVERMMANDEVMGQQRGGDPANTPDIDNRSDEISQRIEEGVRSGQISRRDARRLQTRERNFERREDSFRSDGVVTQQERRQLRDELAALSDQVDRAMRNNRRY